MLPVAHGGGQRGPRGELPGLCAAVRGHGRAGFPARLPLRPARHRPGRRGGGPGRRHVERAAGQVPAPDRLLVQQVYLPADAAHVQHGLQPIPDDAHRLTKGGLRAARRRDPAKGGGAVRPHGPALRHAHRHAAKEAEDAGSRRHGLGKVHHRVAQDQHKVRALGAQARAAAEKGAGAAALPAAEAVHAKAAAKEKGAALQQQYGNGHRPAGELQPEEDLSQ